MGTTTSRSLLHATIALLGVLWTPAGLLAGSGQDETEFVDKGVRVQFSIQPSEPGESGKGIVEGGYADLRFTVADAASGAPVSPLEPAVWVSRRNDTDTTPCKAKIASYLQGTLATQAEIDLNKYFLLILNDDASISVVDPLLGVSGITQLYTMIPLASPGEDWARSADDQRLFVTLPKSSSLAVVDLSNFEVLSTVEAGDEPTRVMLQPDGRFLWVGSDTSDPASSGVTVLDAHSLEVRGFLPTGRGHHEIAFSDDSLFAYVSNTLDGSLTVVDTQALEIVRSLPVPGVAGVEYSPLRQAAFAISETRGTVSVVDGASHEVSQQVQLDVGVGALRFAPGGRWGFVANPATDEVTVIDASSGAIAHRFEVPDRPNELAFTDTYAYVRRLDSAEVTLIPLAPLGGRAPFAIQQVPLGSAPPGAYSDPAAAPSISPTGEWTAVVATNPVDRMVYYYMEGMIAPMGSFTSYGRTPRGVGIVDRSIREVDKGVYGSRVRIPASGRYEVAFLIDSPWVHHCFSFEATADPALSESRPRGELSITFLNDTRSMVTGKPFTVRFALSDKATGEPAETDRGVAVLVTRPPGVWQQRTTAESLGGGRYEVTIAPDTPGVYYLSISVPARGVDFTDLPYVSLRAIAAPSADQGASDDS